MKASHDPSGFQQCKRELEMMGAKILESSCTWKKHPPIGLSGEWCCSHMPHSWVLLLNWDNEARVPPLLATTSYYQFSLFAACIVKSSKTKISKISLTCPRNQLYTFSKRTRASMDYVWFWNPFLGSVNRHTGLSQWCFTWCLKIIIGISACIHSDMNPVKGLSTDGLKPHCWGWMHACSANLHSLARTKHTALTFFANTHFGKQSTETQWNGIDWQLERNINERKVDQRKVCKIFICWSRLSKKCSSNSRGRRQG